MSNSRTSSPTSTNSSTAAHAVANTMITPWSVAADSGCCSAMNPLITPAITENTDTVTTRRMK